MGYTADPAFAPGDYHYLRIEYHATEGAARQKAMQQVEEMLTEQLTKLWRHVVTLTALPGQEDVLLWPVPKASLEAATRQAYSLSEYADGYPTAVPLVDLLLDLWAALGNANESQQAAALDFLPFASTDGIYLLLSAAQMDWVVKAAVKRMLNPQPPHEGYYPAGNLPVVRAFAEDNWAVFFPENYWGPRAAGGYGVHRRNHVWFKSSKSEATTMAAKLLLDALANEKWNEGLVGDRKHDVRLPTGRYSAPRGVNVRTMFAE